MEIYITKNNRQLGPFEESKAREMLAAGQLSPDDAAICHGETQWQKSSEIIPQTTPAIQAAPKKSRKGLLLGCGGFFLVLVLIGGVSGILAFRNLRPADSKEDLPDTVKDFKLDNRYPPKGNVWGTETTFTGIYYDAAKAKTVIYLMTVYASESAAQDAMHRKLVDSCKTGESPMYFNFVKNGATVSEGATCAAPLLVRKDNKLAMIGGSSAEVEDLIEFAENLSFNGGAAMIKK